MHGQIKLVQQKTCGISLGKEESTYTLFLLLVSSLFIPDTHRCFGYYCCRYLCLSILLISVCAVLLLGAVLAAILVPVLTLSTKTTTTATTIPQSKAAKE
jgi:hypothetical protein